MLWEIEIQPEGRDRERDRVCEEFNLLNPTRAATKLIARTARGYLVEGDLGRSQAEQLLCELLVDPLAESGQLISLQISDCRLQNENGRSEICSRKSAIPSLSVLLKPGVMDPAAMSVVEAARDLGIPVDTVRTFRRYYLTSEYSALSTQHSVLQKVLANDAIERIVTGPISPEHLQLGAPYRFQLITVPLRERDDAALMQLSRQRQLSLNLAEMRAIQAHYRQLGREPTDVELETLAQTWSEHCSHKTLKGKIDFEYQPEALAREADPSGLAHRVTVRHFENLLKETIFEATREIRNCLGPDDWCVSVFEDNAGVVRFDDQYHVCFKVETHNHPSAIEPYGGANTGLGGVIRDPLGTGLGARPVCNTDVFCFAPPDTPPDALPPGVLHPVKVIKGVVAGVRDYGNRMGIPTVNGAVCFDERYLANPLVFCGTIGLIPVQSARKEPRSGDLIVAVGGRTGRDGIHGATFSSRNLSSESEKVSGGAVQIGNAITEKKMLDVLLQARDLGLYHAITDCGAGGFSSAIGEMGEKIGVVVQLDQAPLKYEGLSYTEIWISEAQERMVLAVPPDRWPVLKMLCASEDVEAAVIGRFEATGRLRLRYQDQQVADLDMQFLHHGRPPIVRQAIWRAGGISPHVTADNQSLDERGGVSAPVTANNPATWSILGANAPRSPDFTATLRKILSSYNVCSKEWIIRQYDHEVQGGSVLKPLVGAHNDGPGDAAVITPVLSSWAGLAVGCGINPRYGDLDPYHMAAAAIDEAVRNVVAVGADPTRIALLDNFCWGNTERPEVLGSLVRAAEACRDVALAYTLPFISGKDSLNNEFHHGDWHLTIPPTLLISALGRVPDVRRCVTMDLKEPGNLLFLVGVTKDEMGGSHYNLVNGIAGGVPPQVDLGLAPRLFRQLHEAIQRGLVRACHDLSEGGLAAAAAEMALAGAIGADLRLDGKNLQEAEEVMLFAESTTRFLIEVRPANAQALERCLEGVPCLRIGQTCEGQRLRIAGGSGQWIIQAELTDLKEAWQQPLRW
jgi:phosphoribosylformylglycinamidine (FGAM) synthase-like enzyme/phosphoribosylformylglycinamidine (FGAM) synthase PurS component